jgi:hypothetical protein
VRTVPFKKKALIFCVLVGFAAAIAGLVCEFLEVHGLNNQTGYVHLHTFDSLFYSYHSKRAVVTTVFFLNFFLGATLGGILWRVFCLVQSVQRPRRGV